MLPWARLDKRDDMVSVTRTRDVRAGDNNIRVLRLDSSLVLFAVLLSCKHMKQAYYLPSDPEVRDYDISLLQSNTITSFINLDPEDDRNS